MTRMTGYLFGVLGDIVSGAATLLSSACLNHSKTQCILQGLCVYHEHVAGELQGIWICHLSIAFAIGFEADVAEMQDTGYQS